MVRLLIAATAVLAFLGGVAYNLLQPTQQALGAPTYRIERTILPETDSTYELGTSTRAWLRINTDEVCIAGDCKVAWPSAGGSFLSTSSPWTVGNLAYVVSNSAVSSVATTTLTGTYPLSVTNSPVVIGSSPAVFSLAFGTTTANTWSQLQTFTLGTIYSGVASPTHSTGKLVYDTDNESLTFYNSETDVALQIGQENWMRVRNETGSTITNGQVVYVNGNHAGTGLPTVALADADAETTSIAAGIATHDIENNTTGYITTEGTVRGLNTSGFSNGDRVYVSSTAGALTATIPNAPAYRNRVGVVTRSNAANGSIYVTLTATRLGNGTANQIFGMNNAGTTGEYKSLVYPLVGGAGSISLAFGTTTSNTWASTQTFGTMVATLANFVSGTLRIPYNAALSLTTNGDTGIDSTSNQFRFFSGGAERVLGNGNFYPTFTYATSTSWTGTTTIPLGTAYVGETWNGVQCFTDTGTLNVSFYDGTNRMNMLNASTTVGTVTLSTNNTFTAAEKRYVDVGTPASSPTKISCTVNKSLTAD